jgi:hypothetical protein
VSPEEFAALVAEKRELVLQVVGPTPHLERIAQELAIVPALTDEQRAAILALIEVPTSAA